MTWDESRYDAFYDTLQARRENVEIRRLLRTYFGDAPCIVDLGCGTGLGQDLIPSGVPYYGVDVNPKMIRHCMERRTGNFFVCDASEALKSFYGPKMALFSLSDFPISAIIRFASEDKAFAVLYNRPYLEGSASAFCKKRWSFFIQYGMKTLFTKSLLFAAGFKIFNLLGEPYYFVAVKTGREGHRCKSQPRLQMSMLRA